MLFLTSIADFGFAFNHNMTIEYATREGARVGGALVTGVLAGGTLADCTNKTAKWVDPDTYVVAAAQRVLESAGSPIDFSQVGNLVIYEVSNTGTVTGNQNVWTPAPGQGPMFDINGDGTPDEALDFKLASSGWSACTRSNGEPPGSIGVGLTYTYKFKFGFPGIISLLTHATWTQIPMSDKTVMAFNPTQ